MELTRYQTASAFLEQAEAFLLQREAEHNLILGLSPELSRNPLLYGSQPYMAVVHDGDAVVAVALMTPPHNLILSHIADRAALDLIAADLVTFEAGPSGVLGDTVHAAAFAVLWTEPRQLAYQRTMAERIFQLSRVRPQRPVTGSFRPVTPADRPLLMEWVAAFHAEATPNASPPDPEAAVARWFTGGARTLYLWEADGTPVTMAGTTGQTSHGIRIGPVYTPPAYRRRGYASALVAGVSQQQLDSGRSFCVLYTDLSNPISNHIYQEIGYQPVIDVDEYRFRTA